MLSPVGDMVTPEEGDIVSPNYESGVSSDADAYFDTWINLERALSIHNPDDISANIDSTKWLTYQQNDDSSEMPAQPSGSNYNSLMRLSADQEPLVSNSNYEIRFRKKSYFRLECARLGTVFSEKKPLCYSKLELLTISKRTLPNWFYNLLSWRSTGKFLGRSWCSCRTSRCCCSKNY